MNINVSWFRLYSTTHDYFIVWVLPFFCDSLVYSIRRSITNCSISLSVDKINCVLSLSQITQLRRSPKSVLLEKTKLHYPIYEVPLSWPFSHPSAVLPESCQRTVVLKTIYIYVYCFIFPNECSLRVSIMPPQCGC